MNIKDAVVLVTGANRGLGLAFAEELLARGARKVYAAARDPGTVTLAGVVPVKLDVTDAAQVADAAAQLKDVTLLINNAGISRGTAILSANAIEALQAEIETNVYGPLRLSEAFAPILQKNGGGAIVNVLSALSWVTLPGAGTYSASKSAAWSVTNSLRDELRAQHTQVVGVHVAFMDTDMTKGLQAPKASPKVVAAKTLDVLEAGGDEVLADETSQQIKAGLSAVKAPYLNLSGA